METDASLTHSQAPTPCPYPDPDQSIPCLAMPILEDILQYCPPAYSQVFQVVFALQNSPPKPRIHLSFLLFMSSGPAISFLSVRLHAHYNNCHNKRINALLNQTHTHAHAHTHVCMCVNILLM